MFKGLKRLKHKEFVDIIYWEFQKASDKVSHKLFSKSSCAILKSVFPYKGFKDKKQRVYISELSSEYK